MSNFRLLIFLSFLMTSSSARGAETSADNLNTTQTLPHIHEQICANDESGALKTLQDFFENGRKVPALFGIRTSYILDSWAQLAMTYAPARQSLLALRDRDAAELVAGSDIPDLLPAGSFPHVAFIEVSSIDHYLGEEGHAIRLFYRLDDQKPKLAKYCLRAIREQLLASGYQETCLRYLDNPKQEIDFPIQNAADLTTMAPQLAEDERKSCLRDVDFVISVLAANNQIDACQQIAKRPDLITLHPGWADHVARLIERHRSF